MRSIGAAAGRGCSRGGGERCGLGRATDGASSDLDESSSIDRCSLLQPLAREIITKMMSQTRTSMLASFTVLTGWAGFSDVVARD